MDTTLVRYAEPPRTDIAAVWRAAIRGDKDARATLLRRIMAPATLGRIDRAGDRENSGELNPQAVPATLHRIDRTAVQPQREAA